MKRPLLDCLDDAGLRDNTVLIYMGDNGFELGEHGFYDKRDAFEHSIRVPMIARAPGRIAAGTVIDAMVQNIDIAPTLLDLAEVEATEASKFDGQSMRRLWQKGNGHRDTQSTRPWRDHI
ncbi:sulfatase/phosphatase domain-containing protein [Novipirellula artificiosorum]|uniref:Arylsulfatase n=1 Tax=Novipirellula artificiosorum TaxID=2528016 RepID=A0A5C6D415_9BACT|nr:sulfatase/phosphatase domain-containing protein [Novipirellula artificiosorum]TWU31963.1 Arylsulfatase [Novipirellula artificiosorum]